MKLPQHVLCLDCGWYGDEPDEVGNHAPSHICVRCKSQKLYMTVFGNRADFDGPLPRSLEVGPGSTVWALGKGCPGIVCRTRRGSCVKVLWQDGTNSCHMTSELGRVR